MHIVVVTRHLARAAFYFGPVLRALTDGETQVTLIGPMGTDLLIAERKGLVMREIALRPYGEKPLPMEWAVLAGDLFSMLQEQPSESGTVDVVMSLEEDLEETVVSAARAVRARLVVTAADVAPNLTLAQQLIRQSAPLRARVRAAIPAGLKDSLAMLQHLPARERAQELVERLAAQLPQNVRSLSDAAAESAVHAAAQLKNYLEPPPVHYLLAEEPRGKSAPAGWTAFPFGAGLDVTRFLIDGEGRTFPDAPVDEAPLRVGFYGDPFADGLKRHTALAASRTAAQALEAQGVEWVEPTVLPEQRDASLVRWAQSYLASLDVVVVPGPDLYAAMQAAASGCVVITLAESLASRAMRAGESGLEVAALDGTQLRMALQSLRRGRQAPRMQDAAQRRATRLFEHELLLRRLTRGMEDNLQVVEGEADQPTRIVRRHI